MAAKEEFVPLSGGERMLYFGLIPLLFTTLLVGIGIYIINQGKGETFAGVLTKAGENVLQAGKSMISKKQAASAVAGTATGGSAVGAGVGAAGATAGGAPVGAGSTNAASAATTTATPSTTGTATTTGAATTTGTPTTAGAQSGTAVPTATGIPTAAQGSDLKQQTDAAASEFTAMSAAQAATILDNMTLKDEVYNMLGMKPQQRATILAKMEPKKAAAVSKALKDFPPVSSDNAADVQKKLDSLPDNPQSVDELVKTYSQMPATSAASLITELMKTNAKEAVSIMANLDAGTRASILTAMSSSKDPASLKSATAISQMLLKAN
jgi:flagellar motility protein MotE (MotC chaperone)